MAALAGKVNGRVQGDQDCLVSCIAPIDNASPDSLTFVANKNYLCYLETTKAAAVIISEKEQELFSGNAIIVDNPYLAYAKATALLHPQNTVKPGIDTNAVVASSSIVADSASIGPFTVVEDGVEIGENVVIGSHCVIAKGCKIDHSSRLLNGVKLLGAATVGKRVILHTNCIIGDDGFGLANDDGKWIKIPQLGRVIIGDDVEVGSGCTIDRGALQDTVLEDGVKIDNLVHIAHNVTIGAHSAIAALTGIAGSTSLGKRNMVAGCVGINGHIEICDDVTLTGMSMVTKSISEPGVYSSGIPADKNKVWRKNTARFRHLDELTKQVKKLDKMVDTEKESNK